MSWKYHVTMTLSYTHIDIKPTLLTVMFTSIV